MSITISKLNSEFPLRNEIIDFEERPSCSACDGHMTVCSHSTPSKVIGFDGIYYTEYREYSCNSFNCPNFKKRKHRAPNPWRIDRHKYDLRVEAEIVRLRFKERKTYREIKNTLLELYSIKISEKTIGNIISRYGIATKLGTCISDQINSEIPTKVFITIDTMAPIKGENKHIVAMDYYTNKVLLVEAVSSENTKKHTAFQQKLKKGLSKYKIELLGFMSDDHVAQRNAIKDVWGDEMKHCRCLFHFEKRIMSEPFNLNSRLKTKAKSGIRKIYYVKLYREEKLKMIENSQVWDYLLEIIKDLVILQTWKNKRNDTRLESIDFYDRLRDIKNLLIELRKITSTTLENAYEKEKKILNIILSNVSKILGDYRQTYLTLKRISGYQKKLRFIFGTHSESSKTGLARLLKYTKKLENKLKSGKITSDEEKSYIEQLYTFVYDRGESLFHYRDIENACNTNNTQENKFKKMKHDIKRTQGLSVGARYLQRHAKYQMYVDPNATREEIYQILLNADYKAIARIMKEDREKNKRKLPRIKDKKRWEKRIEQIRKIVSNL